MNTKYTVTPSSPLVFELGGPTGALHVPLTIGVTPSGTATVDFRLTPTGAWRAITGALAGTLSASAIDTLTVPYQALRITAATANAVVEFAWE